MMKKEIDIGFEELENGRILLRDRSRQLRTATPYLVLIIGEAIVIGTYFFLRADPGNRYGLQFVLTLLAVIFLIVIGAYLYINRTTFDLKEGTYRIERGLRPMVEDMSGNMSEIKRLTLTGGATQSDVTISFCVSIEWKKRLASEVKICSFTPGPSNLMEALQEIDQRFVALANRLNLPYENMAFPSPHQRSESGVKGTISAGEVKDL